MKTFTLLEDSISVFQYWVWISTPSGIRKKWFTKQYFSENPGGNWEKKIQSYYNFSLNVGLGCYKANCRKSGCFNGTETTADSFPFESFSFPTFSAPFRRDHDKFVGGLLVIYGRVYQLNTLEMM